MGTRQIVGFVTILLLSCQICFARNTNSFLYNQFCNRSPRSDAPDFETKFTDTDLNNIRKCLGLLRTKLKDHDELICAKIEDIDEDLFEHDIRICSKIEDLDMDLSEHDTRICSKIEDIDEDLFEHDARICSKIEDIDMDLEDHNDLICSKIDDLADCNPISIFGPITITEPGHYCLAEGFTATVVGGGITIDSDNVVLDLNGQTILVESNFTAIFIRSHSKIVICNGIIRNEGEEGFAGGISITQNLAGTVPTSIRIKDIKLCSASIRISNANGVMLENCELDKNQILISDSSHIVCKWCTIRNAPEEREESATLDGAFEVHGSSFCCFIGCKALSNQVNGFYVDPLETGMGGTSHVYSFCISQNNNKNGFLIAEGEALTVIKNCVANKNGEHGIEDQGFNTVMRNCFADGNVKDGYNISGSNCELRDSSAVVNGEAGIRSTGAGLVVCNNTSHDNTGMDLIGVEDSNLCNGQQKICSKIDDLAECTPISIFGPIIITEPGYYCLAQGFTATKVSGGITIDSDNVVLDLNGQTILVEPIDIVVAHAVSIKSHSNIVICNGIIRNKNEEGLSSGILIFKEFTPPNPIPTSICIKDVKFCSASIDIIEANGVTVENCELDKQQLKISSSSHIVCKWCTVRNAPLPFKGAFEVHGSSFCCFIGCKALSSQVNGFYVDAVMLAGGGTSHVFSSCISQNNDKNGFFIANVFGNGTSDEILTIIKDCVANKNGEHGIKTEGSNTVIRNCFADGNTKDGYNISSDNCELRDSSAVGNGEVGIRSTGTGLVVCDNTSHDNTGMDLVGVEDSNLCTGQQKICSKIDVLDSKMDVIIGLLT